MAWLVLFQLVRPDIPNLKYDVTGILKTKRYVTRNPNP
jgi:hypothetical protein